MCVQVKYSIVQQPNQKGTKFTVDEETGEKVVDQEVMDRLTQRADDTEEALAKRLETYAGNRDAIAEAFKAFATTVDGNRDPADVWGDIKAYLDVAPPFE